MTAGFGTASHTLPHLQSFKIVSTLDIDVLRGLALIFSFCWQKKHNRTLLKKQRLLGELVRPVFSSRELFLPEEMTDSRRRLLPTGRTTLSSFIIRHKGENVTVFVQNEKTCRIFSRFRGSFNAVQHWASLR